MGWKSNERFWGEICWDKWQRITFNDTREKTKEGILQHSKSKNHQSCGLPWSCERYVDCFAVWLEDDKGSSNVFVVVVVVDDVVVVAEASSGSPRKKDKCEARIWALFTLPVKFAKSSRDNLQRSKPVVGNFSGSRFSSKNCSVIQLSQTWISRASHAKGSENWMTYF